MGKKLEKSEKVALNDEGASQLSLGIDRLASNGDKSTNGKKMKKKKRKRKRDDTNALEEETELPSSTKKKAKKERGEKGTSKEKKDKSSKKKRKELELETVQHTSVVGKGKPGLEDIAQTSDRNTRHDDENLEDCNGSIENGGKGKSSSSKTDKKRKGKKKKDKDMNVRNEPLSAENGVDTHAGADRIDITSDAEGEETKDSEKKKKKKKKEKKKKKKIETTQLENNVNFGSTEIAKAIQQDEAMDISSEDKPNNSHLGGDTDKESKRTRGSKKEKGDGKGKSTKKGKSAREKKDDKTRSGVSSEAGECTGWSIGDKPTLEDIFKRASKKREVFLHGSSQVPLPSRKQVRALDEESKHNFIKKNAEFCERLVTLMHNVIVSANQWIKIERKDDFVAIEEALTNDMARLKKLPLAKQYVEMTLWRRIVQFNQDHLQAASKIGFGKGFPEANSTRDQGLLLHADEDPDAAFVSYRDAHMTELVDRYQDSLEKMRAVEKMDSASAQFLLRCLDAGSNLFGNLKCLDRKEQYN